MALSITNAADLERQKQKIQYNLILEIDGVTTLYGAIAIKEVIKYGNAGLTYGGGCTYGELVAIENQQEYISFDGSSTQISQQLRPDQGSVSSVPSLTLALLDTNNEITDLISPGVTLTDMLGRRAKVWFGFKDSEYPADYIIIHRGRVEAIDSGPGLVSLTISHAENKKRQKFFEKATSQLDGAINASVTTLNVDSANDFFAPVNGPDGAEDSTIKFYLRINDEIIQYGSITSNTFNSLTRGALGTTAASHSDNDEVESFIVIEGEVMLVALKILLSGVNGPYIEDEPITNFVQIGDGSSVANAIWFDDIDVEVEYGLTLGDYITTTGASNGANNVTLKVITEIVKTDIGSYIVIGSESFVAEADTAAVIDFRSQYDTLGEGMALGNDEVDIAEHLRLRTLFLSSFNQRHYVKDTLEGDKWLEKEVYAPASAFAIPRKARSSVGIHSAPIPGDIIQTFDKTNIRDPDKLVLRRRMGRHFFNTIVHRMDVDELEDKFKLGVINQDATSKSQIPVGNRTRTIDASGMRSDLNGTNLANQSATRLLDRYKFAAEHIDEMKVFFKDGFQTEPGDKVLFDPTDLKMSNTADGTRVKPIKFFEVLNKKLNLKTGDITLSLIDTNFDGQDRFALISPSSFVKAANSTSQIVIKKSFSTPLTNEGQKWEDLIGAIVEVRSPDGTTRIDQATIQSVAGDTITFTSALSFTPLADDLMTLAEYNGQPDKVHLIFAFMNNAAFDDGTDQYAML